MKEIVKNAEIIKNLVLENVQTRQNTISPGVLTSNQGDYLACLKIDHEQMEELLKSDQAHWA